MEGFGVEKLGLFCYRPAVGGCDVADVRALTRQLINVATYDRLVCPSFFLIRVDSLHPLFGLEFNGQRYGGSLCTLSFTHSIKHSVIATKEYC